VPFRAAITAGVRFIMTAHILVPSLDETQPATLSRRIVYDLLRDELGFESVILSDDLEMKAIAATIPVPEAAVRAIAAGCDGLLVCSGKPDVQYATLERLVHAVEDGTIPVKRLEDAQARLRRAKEQTLAVPPGRVATAKTLRETLGCDAHRRVADEMLQFA